MSPIFNLPSSSATTILWVIGGFTLILALIWLKLKHSRPQQKGRNFQNQPTLLSKFPKESLANPYKKIPRAQNTSQVRSFNHIEEKD